jgi:hypothetical protein
MIKLTDLINELDKPKNIYAPGANPETPSDDFLQRGYRMTNTTIDPETGKTFSDVEYLPEFDRIKMEIGNFAKTFRTYKFSSNPDIASVATKLVTALNKADQLTTVLNNMVKNRV